LEGGNGDEKNRVNSPGAACGCCENAGGAAGVEAGRGGTGSPIGLGGAPAWNMRVNSPGPCCGGGGAAGFGAGWAGSPIGTGAEPVWNMRVNSPGPG
jgi:hypothetical protein